MAHNATLCGNLSHLFPSTAEVPDLAFTPGIVVVRSIPTSATLLVLCLIAARRVFFSSSWQRVSLLLGGLVLPTSAALTWHLFDLLECGEVLRPEDAWRWIALVGSAAAQLLLLFVAWPRFPCLGSLAALAVAGGCVAMDWALQGGGLLFARADPLIALQHLWCILAAVLAVRIFRAPVRIRSTLPRVDALAKREERETERGPVVGKWTWFW